MTGPKAFLVEGDPTHSSIKLGGRYINASLISQELNISHGYLCRVLAGERTPTIEYAEKLAGALRMSFEELREAIYERKHRLKLDRFGAE